MGDFLNKLIDASKLDHINSALEESSWFFMENYLEDHLCDSLRESFVDKENLASFSKSKIGRGSKSSENSLIRNGLIRWIEDWNQNESLSELNKHLIKMMKSIGSYFRLPLKRFEAQFSIYSKGGFYNRHLDQHQNSRHRHISICLYLNDCEEGGELILYKKGSQSEVEKIIKPRKGTLVVFISKDIPHEVKLVESTRHSITSWFRDDETIPFV